MNGNEPDNRKFTKLKQVPLFLLLYLIRPYNMSRQHNITLIFNFNIF